ncbi:MAG: hypothetical protein AAFR79_14140 [Pseudomonadota bacterium]
MKPRKLDPLDRLLAGWIVGSAGDTGRIETGAAQPNNPERPARAHNCRITAHLGRRRSALIAFKGLTGQDLPGTEAETIDRSCDFRSTPSEDQPTQSAASIDAGRSCQASPRFGIATSAAATWQRLRRETGSIGPRP